MVWTVKDASSGDVRRQAEALQQVRKGKGKGKVVMG